MIRYFLADDDLTPTEQAQVLDLAAQMKADPLAHRPYAGPRSVAVLFDKASTRTRVSFEVGIAELGGHPLIIDAKSSQLGRGEPIKDTARVLGRHVAAIVWRTFGQERLEEMAEYAGVPVINALTDSYHPCQILADWLTLREEFGQLAGLTFAYVGDGANNMAHSYLLGGALAGMNIRIGAPASHQPDAEVVRRAEAIAVQTGGSVAVTTDAREAVVDSDVVCTDTWVSMGQEDQKTERIATFGAYSVTDDLVDLAAARAVVLHCLPAYRGLEIAESVLEGPRSRVWAEAENRRHAQKALLAFCDQQSKGE